jgi:hypothetical protein
MDGWPGFSCFAFPFRNRGCPALAFFARTGTMLLVPWVCYAQRFASHLRRSSPALYHYLVLPAIAFSAQRAQPPYLPHDSGTDSRALSLCSRRVCRDAGTHSPASDRTRSWDSLDRDASREAAHGSRVVAQAQTEEPAPTQSVWRRGKAPSVLASALLRLQCMDHEKARGEVAVYKHRNPVKRGLVGAPEERRWSSCRFYLLEEAGPVRVNEGGTKISFRDWVASLRSFGRS